MESTKSPSLSGTDLYNYLRNMATTPAPANSTIGLGSTERSPTSKQSRGRVDGFVAFQGAGTRVKKDAGDEG